VPWTHAQCEEEDEPVKHGIDIPATIRTREKIYGKQDVNFD
jgi:hypothetical protein